MSKLVAIKSSNLRTIDHETRKAVQHALDNNYPFVMVAQRPDGSWETSCFYRAPMTYEVVGALESIKHNVLFGEQDED